MDKPKKDAGSSEVCVSSKIVASWWMWSRPPTHLQDMGDTANTRLTKFGNGGAEPRVILFLEVVRWI